MLLVGVVVVIVVFAAATAVVAAEKVIAVFRVAVARVIAGVRVDL